MSSLPRRAAPAARAPFARAAIWLSDLACAPTAAMHQSSLDDQLRLLFGLWLCDQALGDGAPSPALAETARRVKASLHAQVQAGTFVATAHDATLLLLAARIVRDQGGTTPGVDTFAAQIAAALTGLPTVPLQFTGQAVFLANLGLMPRPPVPPLTAGDVPGAAVTLLQADKAHLRALAATIAAATHFGRAAPHGDPERLRTLRQVLQPVLLDLLRRGDIDTGAPLLRTLRYLRLTRSRTARAAAATVSGQQQPSGKFGYFTGLARAASDDATARDLDLGLHLPITVSCLWSLAETTVPGFSVLAPARSHPPRPLAPTPPGGTNGH